MRSINRESVVDDSELREPEAGAAPPERHAEASGFRTGAGRLRGLVAHPEPRAFLAGLLVALPLLVLFPHGVSIGSPDSGVVVSTAAFVRDIDHDWLLESQEPPLLQVVYGPWLGVVDDSHALVLVPLLSTIILVAFSAALAARITRSAVAGSFAGLALLAMTIPVPQSRLLPLYAAFIAFGVLGTWLALRFVRTEHASRWVALGAAVSILLSMIAHGAGLYFLTLVGALVLFVKDRSSARSYAELLGLQVLVLVPWIVAHLWVDGLDRFLTPRSTWVVTGGHKAKLTLDFWDQGVQSAGDIFTFLPQQFLLALGTAAWLVVPLALIGFARLSLRMKMFSVVAAAGLVAPMVLYQARVFPRYFYPLLPCVAILAAIGLAVVLAYLKRSRIRRAAPAVVCVVVIVVAGALFSSRLAETLQAAEEEYHSPVRAELNALGSLIDDGRAVIGIRSVTVLLLEAPDVHVYYADLLTEEEFVSYLTWERDDLKEMFNRRNIGWALIRKPVYREVAKEASWLEPAYGVAPSYAREIKRDPMSCLVHNGSKYRLYQLRPAGEVGDAEACL